MLELCEKPPGMPPPEVEGLMAIEDLGLKPTSFTNENVFLADNSCASMMACKGPPINTLKLALCSGCESADMVTLHRAALKDLGWDAAGQAGVADAGCWVYPLTIAITVSGLAEMCKGKNGEGVPTPSERIKGCDGAPANRGSAHTA
mmetsp:Transcript_32835/g.82449  ORF Transcript_32835/g.82449 Transcript_32835/m.82449 type:complete len:147 (-) Transcript_32835:108-548(-)